MMNGPSPHNNPPPPRTTTQGCVLLWEEREKGIEKEEGFEPIQDSAQRCHAVVIYNSMQANYLKTQEIR